jgi:hypothetical protein
MKRLLCHGWAEAHDRAAHHEGTAEQLEMFSSSHHPFCFHEDVAREEKWTNIVSHAIRNEFRSGPCDQIY